MNRNGCSPAAVMLAVVVLFVPVSIGFAVLEWMGSAAAVVGEELAPRELLRRYEWFKDASAQLNMKQADIAVYQARMVTMLETYGSDRSRWSREDRQQYNLWVTETAGLIASYNLLAAEYNAQMAKLNWRFTNVGMLPQGAAEPLPREYAPYRTN